MLKNGTFPQVLIFWGERGLGKLISIKKALESYRNDTGNSVDIEILLPRTHKNKKDKLIWLEDIVDLRNRLLSTGAGKSERFIILDESENLRPDAQNALLKVLEEPGQNTHFILITSSPTHLLSTVRSRSVELKANKLSPDSWSKEMQDFIAKTANKDLKEFYEAHPGFVHRITNEGHDILKEQIEGAYSLISGDCPDRMGAANNMSKSEWSDLRLFTDIVASFLNNMQNLDTAKRKAALESVLATTSLIEQYSNKGLALQHLALIEI